MQGFPFQDFECIMALLWPAKFLQRNQLIALWGFPHIKTHCFSLAAFKILFIFHFCHFNYDMSWCGFVWVHLFWDPLCFLYLDICFIFQVQEVFSDNFIKSTVYNFFSLFSWGPLQCKYLYPSCCPRGPLNCKVFVVLFAVLNV